MSNTIKVLHVYRTYFPDTQGGLEEVIRQICRYSSEVGVVSRVFCLSENPYPAMIELEEAQVYRYKRNFGVGSCDISFFSVHGFKILVAWADVIHYHFPWPFADLLHLATNVKKPTLITYHSDIVRQKYLKILYKPLMKRFLNNADIIVTTSQNYFATSKELCEYAEKVEVVPIGLDENAYPQVDDEFLKMMEKTVGTNFFLFVGVLRYYKGLHILLDAIKSTPLSCVVVGAGPIENELKARAKKEGIKNINFLGYVNDDDKVALFKLCRGVVFPSHLRSEAFGVTLLEGAMYGKPLISTEIGTGTSYINVDGETGFVVPPSNVKALRDAMQTLAQDDQLVERFGAAARQRYEKLFTGKLMGERYIRLYQHLLEK